jgi:tetratricopeptide (TPR) repeat protein
VLHETGVRLWYDEGIDPGNEWADEVARALDNCGFFLVFLSPSAVRSRNVCNEIFFALNHQKPFLAVHLEPTTLTPALDLRISSIQAMIRFRMDQGMYHKKLQAMLAAFRDIAPREVPSSQGGDADDDVETVSRRIAALHRDNRWEDIRRLGPPLATALIANLERDPDAFGPVENLVNLGAYLTDANALVLARRCLEAAADRCVSLIRRHGDSLRVLDHLGMVYNNLGRLARRNDPASRTAESFYRKSAEVFDRLYPVLSEAADLGDRLGMAYANLGNTLVAQKKGTAATEAYGQSLRAYERLVEHFPSNDHILRRLDAARARAK